MNQMKPFDREGTIVVRPPPAMTMTSFSSVGFAPLSSMRETPVPPPQWAKAVELVRMLCAIYRIPTEHIVGHRDHNPIKTCPGLMCSVESFRADVERGVDGER